MPAGSEVFYLCVLAEGQHARPFLCDGRGVDDDGLLLVFRSSVDLGTVAPLGLVSAGLVEELPILLRKVVHENVQLVDAEFVVLLLEVEKQLKRVGSYEELSHELVFPRLPWDENRAVEESPSRDQQPDNSLKVLLVNLVLVHPEVLVDQGQQVLEHKYLGLEGLAGIGESIHDIQFYLLAVLVLPDDVAAQLVDLRLQQDLSDARFRY